MPCCLFGIQSFISRKCIAKILFVQDSMCLTINKLYWAFNSLAPGIFRWNFGKVIFTLIHVINGCDTSCKIILIWMSIDLTNDKSALVQVMAWCRQATSHYLSQCWPRSLSPYGVTRSQWVNRYEEDLPLWVERILRGHTIAHDGVEEGLTLTGVVTQHLQ